MVIRIDSPPAPAGKGADGHALNRNPEIVSIQRWMGTDMALSVSSQSDGKMTARRFHSEQILRINDAVALAEELVSNHYKLSAAQWLRRKYDVRTAVDLAPAELVDGPFAQVIRYEGRKADADLKSEAFDFYKICLQDHAILETLDRSPALRLSPFSLYIITHELIHIVRFTKFLQRFDATDEERHLEEVRVHDKTHEILEPVRIPGMAAVFRFYAHWRNDFDRLRGPA